jgi:ABC-type bacteriocin/lantibiotic exporter with double-glycine peptidase domain
MNTLFILLIAAMPVYDPIDDLVCGPRCLHFILGYFGKHEELTSLAFETQRNGLTKGSRMLLLEEALRKRGLFTLAIRGSESAVKDYQLPVLLHYRYGPNRIGHFAIWLPAKGDSPATYWNGLDEEQPALPPELEFTGHALLASGADDSLLIVNCVLLVRDRFRSCRAATHQRQV